MSMICRSRRPRVGFTASGIGVVRSDAAYVKWLAYVNRLTSAVCLVGETSAIFACERFGDGEKRARRVGESDVLAVHDPELAFEAQLGNGHVDQVSALDLFVHGDER